MILQWVKFPVHINMQHLWLNLKLVPFLFGSGKIAFGPNEVRPIVRADSLYWSSSYDKTAQGIDVKVGIQWCSNFKMCCTGSYISTYHTNTTSINFYFQWLKMIFANRNKWRFIWNNKIVGKTCYLLFSNLWHMASTCTVTHFDIILIMVHE